MNEYLKICVWNANGLAQRSLELKTFLINENIDIMLISETHFTQKNHLNISHYSVYYTNHPDGKSHGGRSVINKTKIKHYENKHRSDDYLQATNVTI